MIEQRNSAVWHKINAISRYALLHSVARMYPLYVVNEYPRSGGSWVGEMLSDALEVPFPRNRLPMLCSSIFHGHFMQSWNVHNAVLVWRDGRDVLVSQYFHSLFKNDRGNARLVDQCRADLNFDDYEDVRGNLPAFMEYVFERRRHPRMSWADFVDRWVDCQWCVHVRYEDLRKRTADELRRVVKALSGRELSAARAAEIVENHSFEKLSGRKVGEENMHSFMRKGIVGDWKNYFSEKAKVVFDGYAGEGLIKLGYEEGHLWANTKDVDS